MLEVFPKPWDKVTAVEKMDNGLLITTERGLLKIEPKRADIFRIRYTRREALKEGTGIAVIRDEAFPEWSYEENDENITLRTERAVLAVSKAESAITYSKPEGEVLLRERAHDPRELESFDSYRLMKGAEAEIEEVKTADGVKKMVREAKKEFDKKLYHTRLNLKFQQDEAIYGLGQFEEGSLNMRGTTQYLHQANRKIAVPMFVSTKGYGMFFATASPAIFNDTAYGTYFYTEADPEMDYYFIQGDSFDQVIAGYRYLTGKAVLLPRWAYGFVQSQERYETQQEMLEVAAEYRRRQLGLDCLVLDWQSWEGNLWGQKTFDLKRFPDVKALTDTLHAENVAMMISIWPNMNEDCDNYKEFQKADLLFPSNNVYDAYDPEGRKLYWKQAEEGIFSFGTDAWWCDSSEPFTPEWARMEKPEPGDMYQAFYSEASTYIPAELTNAYGLVHAQGIYEGQKGSGTSKRVCNLTRNGFSGQQKYGTVLWSGDTAASWDTFRTQIPAGLNFCAAGLPYWTLDIGAFFVKRGMPWYWTGDYNEGLKDLGYQELYTRWFQYGCFLPMFRAHGTDVRREIWNFNGPENCFYKAQVAMNKMRYTLAPYIYSLAGSVYLKDDTIHRLLAFDFPKDPAVFDIKDQFMFGPALMVCPVTEPMYYEVGSQPIDGKKTRKVYLPAGTDWYDYYTNEKYAGGQTIEVDAPIDIIPLFVKAGSIIPVAQPGDSMKDTLAGPITLKVYPGADGDFTLYEDDGDGYEYEDGAYTTTEVTWNDAGQKLVVADPVTPKQWREEAKKEYRIEVIG